MAIKSFETEMKGVKQRCYDLRLIDRFVYDALTPKDQITWVKGLTVLTEGRDALMANPRQRYITTVALISTALHLALTSHLLTPAETEIMAIWY